MIMTKSSEEDLFLRKNYLVLDYITMSYACPQDPGLRFSILLFTLGFTLKSEEFSDNT